MKTARTRAVAGAIFALAALSAVAAHAFFASQGSMGCELIVPLDQAKALIDQLDHDTARFASTTVNVMDRSTEGGTQTNYTAGMERKIIEQHFYGETGQAYMRFYFDDNRLFAIVKLNLTYAVPINVDSSGVVKTTEERDYHLNNSGRVCALDINGAAAPVDSQSQDMIRDYIGGIQ
jgi:hypothetical protein